MPSHAFSFALQVTGLVIWLHACTFTADYAQTAYRCEGDGPCPTGYDCRDGVCELEGSAGFEPARPRAPKGSEPEPMDPADAATASHDVPSPEEQPTPIDAAVPDAGDAGESDPCEEDGGPCAGPRCDDAGGACEVFVPRSCLELLDAAPDTADGTYTIDPDGSGPAGARDVFCDMTRGGWTEIYREDFSRGRSSGWRNDRGNATKVDTTSDCAQVFSHMLGGYGILGAGFGTVQTFALHGIPHTQVSLALDYFVIDSWDAVEGQDFALVFVDDSEVYRALFDDSYPRKRLCGSAFLDVGPQQVSAQVPHSNDAVTVRISSTLDGTLSDESYGVDNVVLRIR